MIRTHIPFSVSQLCLFKNEMRRAGSFENLMLEKKALHYDKTLVISLFKDIEEYKDLYLVGIYEDLRPHYDTEVPYLFWGKMLEAVERENN